MTGTENDITVVMIPVDRITVLNPRVRDRKKFLEIVDSIKRVGLKQPIKVSRIDAPDAEAAYNLIYGQGRLEAFVALGQKTIPAIVTNLSEDDSLILSLVENVARRHYSPVETLRAIGTLSERGYSDTEIGRKIGYSSSYVGKIRRLLDAGEERLLVAIETGKMPLKVAMAIAAADDDLVQKVLSEARETHGLTIKQLTQARLLVERRRRYGKAQRQVRADPGQAPVSTTALVHSLNRVAEQQRLLVKRAELTGSQLRFIVQGLRLLLDDEHFVTLLRAEGVHTVPAPLARRLEALKVA